MPSRLSLGTLHLPLQQPGHNAGVVDNIVSLMPKVLNQRKQYQVHRKKYIYSPVNLRAAAPPREAARATSVSGRKVLICSEAMRYEIRD